MDHVLARARDVVKESGGAMHIRHVSVENIRRFGSGTGGVDLDLPPRGWIVIAGPNGAGKTTLLKAIAHALSPALTDDFANTLFSWVHAGAMTARSRLTLVPSGEDHPQPLAPGARPAPASAPGEALLVGDDWQQHHSGVMIHGRESDSNRAAAGPWSLEPKGWFAAGYGAQRRLFGQASATDVWASATTREGAFLTLFRDDASLTHPIRWLMDLDYRRLDSNNVGPEERLEAKRLVDGVIALLNDDLLGSTNVLGVDSRGLSVEQDGQRFSITNLGAGAQVLAALVVDILRHMHARFGTLRFAKHEGHPVVPHEGVVLIDEVEAHLHPAWQRRIGFWLSEHFPNVQFIVTTHSPFVCQAATEGGLIVLSAPGSAVAARIADADAYRRAVNGSVDDALLSELFGLEHTWSDAAEEKRERLARLEARVLTGKAKPAEREDYRSLRAEIPQTMSDEVDRATARLAASGALRVAKQ